MIVSHNSSYDDSKSRDALQRYASAHDWLVQFNDQKAKIDAFAQTHKGRHIAIELQCNSCWTTEDEYPNDIHIPARKFPYFKEIIHPPDGVTITACDEGYFILFNVAHTRAAIIKFSILVDELFVTTQLSLNGEWCEVVLVPTKYIAKYISIPE